MKKSIISAAKIGTIRSFLPVMPTKPSCDDDSTAQPSTFIAFYVPTNRIRWDFGNTVVALVAVSGSGENR